MTATIHDESLSTFKEAITVCADNGGNLAVMRSEEDYEELYTQLKESNHAGNKV